MQCCTNQIFAFEWVPLLTHYFSVISENIGYIIALGEQYGSNFNHCDKAAEFGEITQNNGRYAIQGHYSLPISVLIESLYASLDGCHVKPYWFSGIGVSKEHGCS